MGSFSMAHWIIVLLVVVVLFGRGKISEMMGDVAKGIKSFKKGLAEDEADHVGALPHVDPKITSSEARKNDANTA